MLQSHIQINKYKIQLLKPKITFYEITYFLQRKFIQATSLEAARKLKDFWAKYYMWKTERWPQRITSEEWAQLKQADLLAHPEE